MPIENEASQYYRAGIIYDETVDRGSSKNYGCIEMNVDGVTIVDPENVSVREHQTLQFSPRPDTTDGFVFKGWYSPSNTSSCFTGDPLTRVVTNSDIFLIPAFKPSPSIRYTRQITVSYSGVSETDMVNVKSMKGYWTKTLASASAAYLFNSTDSTAKIADGLQFSVNAKVVDGYDIVFRVNGVPVVSHETQEDSSSTSGGTRGSAGGDTPGDSSSTVLRYLTIDVDNASTATGTPMTVSVEYSPSTVYYTVYTQSTPITGGSAQVKVQGESRYSTSVTAASGTVLEFNAVPATGYTFTSWSSTAETRTTPQFTWNVTGDVTWTAQFNKSANTISVKAQPREGGAVSISNNGTNVGTTITQQQGVEYNLTITAASNRNYNFSHWYESKGSSPNIYYYDSTMPVTFGTYDLEYVAVFDPVQDGSVLVKAYTSTQIGSNPIIIQSGNNGVYFTAAYTTHSSSTTTRTVKSGVEELNVKLQHDTSGYYSSITLNNLAPYYTEENGHRYKYTFTGYKYADTFINESSAQNVWTDVTLENGVWKKYYPEFGPGVTLRTRTLTAVFRKEEMFAVTATVSTPSGFSSDFVITGAGNYTSGETASVSASLAQGVDENRYTFDYWANADNPSTAVSRTNPYSFTVSGDRSLVAVFIQKSYIDYTAEPDTMGTVTGTAAAQTWMVVGTELTLTATPGAGASVLNWTAAGSQIFGAVNSITVNVPASDTKYICNLMEGSHKLTVTSSAGGSVNIDLLDSGGSTSQLDPDAGTTSEYTIPSNYGFVATAQPDARYRFEEFTEYYGGEVTRFTNPVFTFEDLDDDMALDARFSYIPWNSTLGTIMKVY